MRSASFRWANARLAVYGAAILLAGALGLLGTLLPPLYLVFVLGGHVFAYLLLTKLELAIMVVLVGQYLLAAFNYLGNGTPFHPNGLMGIGLIAGAVFFFLFNKTRISPFRNVSWFLLFFLLCVASAFTVPSQYSMDSLTVTLRLASAICIFSVLLVKLDSLNAVKWVLGAVLAARLLPTASGLLMYAGTTGLSFTSETFRLGNSGVGVYLAMILTLCLAFLLDARAGRERLLWGSLTALYALGLFFSFGRAGWISFIVGAAVIGFRRHKWLLIVAPLTLVLTVMLIPAFFERFSDISLADIDFATNTFAGRIRIWQAAWDIFSQHPVLGVGIGAGRYMVGEVLAQYSWMIHNDYLSVLLETGLVGFTLFIAWHGQWLVSVASVFGQSEHRFDQTLSLAVLAVLVASLVGRFTDNLLLDTYDMYPLSALVASALALPRIRAETGVSGV